MNVLNEGIQDVHRRSAIDEYDKAAELDDEADNADPSDVTLLRRMANVHREKGDYHERMAKGEELEGEKGHEQWFRKLSDRDKKTYLYLHPNSKYAK